MSYRPDGWKNPHYEIFNESPCTETVPFTERDKGNAFEAGADAMLEALMTGVRYRVISEYVDGKELTIDSKNGYLVFIPGE